MKKSLIAHNRQADGQSGFGETRRHLCSGRMPLLQRLFNPSRCAGTGRLKNLHHGLQDVAHDLAMHVGQAEIAAGVAVG